MSDSPQGGGTALLIIDMLNDLEFDGGEQLLPKAERAADAILKLRSEADADEIPVIYVNDNDGKWHSERSRVIEGAIRSEARGGPLSARLQPSDRHYFVIKPRFSGFYATPLPVLLPQLGVSRLILTGVAADICVLFTAADAHMREYDLWVPADAVASEHDQRTHWALDIMKNSMSAETRPTSDLTIAGWKAVCSVDPEQSSAKSDKS